GSTARAIDAPTRPSRRLTPPSPANPAAPRSPTGGPSRAPPAPLRENASIQSYVITYAHGHRTQLGRFELRPALFADGGARPRGRRPPRVARRRDVPRRGVRLGPGDRGAPRAPAPWSRHRRGRLALDDRG